MNQPVFWDLQPPNGATLSLVGSPLGNMTAHSMRLMFPASSQRQVAEWLRQTADFLSNLPIGQSVQTPAPAPLQAVQASAPQQAPQMMPPQYAQVPRPAPVGHNPEHFAAGAPIGHNNVPLPPAFGNGHAHHAAPAASAIDPDPNAAPPTTNHAAASHLQPPPARPPVTHQTAKPMTMPTMAASMMGPPPMLGEDDQPFQTMMPMAAPTTPLDGDTERPPAPQRHAWDRSYEIGVSRCKNCKLVATGTEEPYC